jgi:radical SAM-linked protein
MNSRYRIRFSKLGKLRFTSHRDVARMWERALRRATLPVAYTEGFSPHPKLSFGLALSTGHESLGEYLDIDMAEPVDVEEIPARLDPCLPIGLDVQVAAEIESGTPSLQQVVTSCTWRIEVVGLGHIELAERVQACLGADSLVVTRERKGHKVTDDLRPAILSLEIADAGVGSGRTAADAHARTGEVVAELATQPRGLRPSELVAVLASQPDDALVEGHVCRLHQWMSTDGAREEPLPLRATLAPHAEARAS